MAVAFDAITTGSSTTLALTIAHVPVGTPSGVIALVSIPNTNADNVTGATYGGVAMTEMSVSPVLKSTTEAMLVMGFFLGSSVPSGNQNCVINGTSGGETYIGAVITLTAAADTEIVDTGTVNGIMANPSDTLALASRTCYCALVFSSGHSNVANTTPLTNWTSRVETVAGSRLGGVYTYDIVGTTDVTAGWTQTSDDAVMIAVAVSEVESSGLELELSPGSYAITGQDITLTISRVLELNAGSFSITGQDAILTASRVLELQQGEYTFTGQDVELLISRVLNLSAGSYEITGQDVIILRSLLLELTAGNYQITGQDAELLASRVLELLAGSYAITGQDVTLTIIEAFIKKLAVASMTSRRGSASVSTNRASGSAGVNQGSAAISTSTSVKLLLEDGSGFFELEDGSGVLLTEESRSKRQNATMNDKQGSSTIN